MNDSFAMERDDALGYIRRTWPDLASTLVELTHVEDTDGSYWSVTSNGVHWCNVWKVQQGEYGYSPGNPNPTQWYGEA